MLWLTSDRLRVVLAFVMAARLRSAGRARDCFVAPSERALAAGS